MYDLPSHILSFKANAKSNRFHQSLENFEFENGLNVKFRED